VLPGDITKETDVEGIFAKAVEKFGTIDTVINASGTLTAGAIAELEPAKWWAEYVRINPTTLSEYALGLMSAGNQCKGPIQSCVLLHQDRWR
jgi:NAD(P)-dependent dehydrogenase (short-subunit alcohol dehydrogenase family)